ncbi:SH3 domain-containing protein [Microbotryomycetes sp. JL221]|nr:SH3 domain-containing protein [Microbotryomycetes sp. JL221]
MQKLKGLSMPSFTSPTSFLPSSSSNQFTLTDAAIDDNVRTTLEARRQVVQSLNATVSRLHKLHTKTKPRPLAGITSEKDKALVWLATDLINGADSLTQASPDSTLAEYASTLSSLGDVELALNQHEATFAETLDAQIIQQLDDLAKQYKDYDRTLKVADKLRSVLEQKLAKKAKSATEDDSEVQAQLDYEDACNQVTSLANHLWSNVGLEQDVVVALLDAQLEYARKSVEELQNGRDSIASRPRMTKPVSPVLSRISAAKTNSTRASRSASDSSAPSASLRAFGLRNTPMTDAKNTSSRPTSSSSDSPHQTRRATLSGGSSSTNQDKLSPKRPSASNESATKNRSRSSSMLSRFAPGSILSRATGRKGSSADRDDEDDDEYYDDDDRDDRNDQFHGRSRSNSGGGNKSSRLFDQGSRSVGHSPSRMRPSPSNLRSSYLGRGHDDGENDAVRREFLSGVSLTTNARPSSSGGPAAANEATLQRRPTPLKRMNTAPNPRTSSDFGDSDDLNYRKDQDRGSNQNKMASINRATYVQARWAFKGSSQDELDLDKGDVVKVTKRINDDWWVGRILSPQHKRTQHGMLPKAYVVEIQELPRGVWDDEANGEDDETDGASFLSSSRDGHRDHTDEDEDEHDETRAGDKSRLTPSRGGVDQAQRARSSSAATKMFGNSAKTTFHSRNGAKLKNDGNVPEHGKSPFAD